MCLYQPDSDHEDHPGLITSFARSTSYILHEYDHYTTTNGCCFQTYKTNHKNIVWLAQPLEDESSQLGERRSVRGAHVA